MSEVKYLIELKKLVIKMKSDKRFIDIDVNSGGVGFHVKNVNDVFDDYGSYSVIWNECEDCEGEGQVNYPEDIEFDEMMLLE